MSARQDAHTRSQERPAGGRRSLSLPAWAGIIGPVLFTATFLAQEAFRRSEYDPLAEPVSALEAGPNGWIQQVNFVVFGVLTIAFALDCIAVCGRRGRVSPARRCWSSAGSAVCWPRSSRCGRTPPA